MQVVWYVSGIRHICVLFKQISEQSKARINFVLSKMVIKNHIVSVIKHLIIVYTYFTID